MPKSKKPRPIKIEEDLNKSIETYIPGSDPNTSPHNKGNDVSVKNDPVKDVNIGLIDLYAAVDYYINNKIKPSIIENGQAVVVPVTYESPERWNAAQREGFLRDKDGRVLLPIIAIKREGIVRNRTLGNKIDGNRVHNYQVFQTQYTRKNVYDNFSQLTNRIPVKEYHLAPVPDYVIVTYNCSIFTNMQSQMDSIIQSFAFVSDAYWGQPERYKFKVNIESFTDTISYTQGTDRSIRCNFNIVLNGYLIPDNIVRDLASYKKFLSKAQIKFNVITETGDAVAQPVKNQISNTVIPDNAFLADDNDYFLFQ